MTQTTHIPGNTPGAPPGAPPNPHVPLRTYYAVFAALMILLALTVIAAFLPIGDVAIIIALAIASVKAAMVIAYFMHVKFSSPLTKIFVIASFLWLMILFVFLFADYFTRAWLPMSAGWTDNPLRSQRYVPAVPTPGEGGAPGGY